MLGSPKTTVLTTKPPIDAVHSLTTRRGLMVRTIALEKTRLSAIDTTFPEYMILSFFGSQISKPSRGGAPPDPQTCHKIFNSALIL